MQVAVNTWCALQGAAPAGAGPAAGSEITCLSWNRKVQHIVASSTSNGTTIVWDLKRQKPVISFRDPSRWVPVCLVGAPGCCHRYAKGGKDESA